jgi:predicted Zn-dependent protease
VTNKDVTAGVAEFEKLKLERKLTENTLNIVGYMLQLEGRMADAIAMLEENKKSFPDATKAYQELALAYLRSGNKSKAKENLAASVQKDPGNAQASELLRHL